MLRSPVIAYVELPGYFPIYGRDEFQAQYPESLIDVSLRALIHASVLQSDLGLVPSGHARRLFPDELQHKIRVQAEGFSLPPDVLDKTALRGDLGLPGSAPLVGFAGRTLEAIRGFDVFIKVAKEIRRVRQDVEFLVVGDEMTIYGNEAAYLAEKSFKRHVLDTEGVEEQTIIFNPFMPHDQFIRHLQAMDLIVFPTFEGAGNWALFDAMAAGIPILASNRCFIPEVITHEEEGLLFDPQDVDGFVRAALMILADPSRFSRLGFRAREKIAHRFSVENAADGYASIITEAVNMRRARVPSGRC